MALSVVSALARLGIDPWQEAARLSDLPRHLAAETMERLIGQLPGGRWNRSDSARIAARLVELLPRRSLSPRPVRAKRLIDDDHLQATPHSTWKRKARLWIMVAAGIVAMIRRRDLPELTCLFQAATQEVCDDDTHEREDSDLQDLGGFDEVVPAGT